MADFSASINDTCSCGSVFNISGYSGTVTAQHAKWLDAHTACRFRLTSEQKSDIAPQADSNAAGIDRRPHSRACGITAHSHGTACSSDCPTCGGKPSSDLITNHEFVCGADDRCSYFYGTGSDRERCGNTRERHASGSTTNDEEDPLTSHEATKRVLYRVVHAYQVWRDANKIPNELTDDAVRVGEQHLRLVDWFPENEGWLK